MMMISIPALRVLAAAALLAVCLPTGALAQAPLPLFIDAPPAPAAPLTIARDAAQRATIRAVRVTTPMHTDGRLDEEVYTSVPSASGFIQQTPKPGAPATEATDVWILFDDNNLYISMLCHETNSARRIGTELRRDAQGLTNDDNLMLSIDTFYDRHNAFNFQVNSVGGFRDQLVTDSVANSSWNTIWDVKVANAEGGFSVEMVIPFKSLRYQGSGPQVWGFNMRRSTRWKNEISYINPVPVAYGPAGILNMSTAATLVGIETPARSLNLELKPYAIGTMTTDRTAAVPFNNDSDGAVGVDFKYGLTRSLTADVTVNTDFAQVEEDVQQVNLTRFSLFFPEKREFFLEGLGNFSFAGQGTGGTTDGQSNVPTLFFSRQIGLSRGQTVPVRVGARVTGRTNGLEIGLLNIQTGDDPAAGAVSTNFSVARLRRQILRRSNVGVITTLRHPGVAGFGRNIAFGADANLRFFENIDTAMYIAGTSSEGQSGDDTSYRGNFTYAPDRYGFTLEHLKVGKTFNPEIGFVKRRDFRDNIATVRYSPRLKANPRIRQLLWTGRFEYITNSDASVLQNRDLQGDFAIDFHNSDRITWTYLRQHELLPGDFAIASGVVVPRGIYDYSSFLTTYALGNQRKVSGTVTASRGSFYGGTRTTGGYTGRLSFSPRFVMEPGISLNRVVLPYGTFTANLLSTRVVITPSPRMQLSSLVQLNPSAHTLTSSVRLRWEYVPGSELFVVYSDGRTTNGSGYPDLLNRTLAVKITRLVRF